MEATTAVGGTQGFAEAMAARMATLAGELGTWALAAPRSLADLERETLGRLRDLSAVLLEGTIQLTAPAAPAAEVACACGASARLVRWRPAQVRTLLGPITVRRPYYHCAACHHGVVPCDAQLGLVAGSTSAGLDELLALLGAQESSFAQAATVLEKLTLMHVCPNLVRRATEQVGAALAAAEADAVTAAWAGALPEPPERAPDPCYVSLDGVLVHAGDGWTECKLGAVYTTSARPSRTAPETTVLRAQDASYLAAFGGPEAFGQRLWCEAARRGVLAAPRVVAIGDGAHWIWNLVAEQFPTATQIVDWYHAVAYLTPAAAAIYGEGTDLAQQWVQRRRGELWAGQVPAVLAALEPQRAAGPAVDAAISYYTHNQARMDYPAYRDQGLQIGSGPIESGCRHVIGLRLKAPGMRWQRSGAQAVATVRAWLKSGRWEEAMALRPARQRTYQRHAA